MILTQHNVDPQKSTLFQRLALIGSTRRGALEYHPDKSISSKDDFMDFDEIVPEAEIILNYKEEDVSVDDLYRYSGSSGGTRPKVFTAIDNNHWLVKFKAISDNQNIGEIEYKD